MVLANSSKTIKHAVASAADDPLMRGIDDELALTARRRRTATTATKIAGGRFTFQKYYALPANTLPGAFPAPQKALELLHRLGADAGIVGIMQQHEYVSFLL